MSSRTIKNIGSGLFAQFCMGILGLVALPVFARGLGPDTYGLLALNLALINFASVADLGVGRAVSRYLAEDFEKKETFRTQQFVSTAMSVTIAMGLVGTIVLCLLSPVLVNFAFRIPVAMQREARISFWISGAGLLPILVRMMFDGILAGHHRIVVLNFSNLLANGLRIVLSIAAILSGYSLLTVLIINVVMSYLHAGGLWLYARRYFARRVRFTLGWHASTAKQLLKLGLISTVSFIMANIVFLYADRFIIAAFLPLALAGYYTMSFDISSRQAYISNSIAATFFPLFSGHGATSAERLERSYLQAMKAMAVGTTGVAMLLVVFCKPLLTYWIAPSFSANGATALLVLAIAYLFSTYFQIQYVLIIAAAPNPGICVPVFSVAVFFHIGLSILLLKPLGIVGVAIAFAVAYFLVFCYLLWWVSRNIVRVGLARVVKECFLAAWATAAVLGAICYFMILPAVHSLLLVLLAFGGGYLGYLACCAYTAFSSRERNYFRDLLKSRFVSSSRPPLTLLGDEP